MGAKLDLLTLLLSDKHMCLTCGCNIPNDNHGDQRNITLQALKDAGDAVGITIGEAIVNLIKTTVKVVKDWAQYKALVH